MLLLEFFTCLTARGHLVIYFKLLLLWYLVLKCSRVDYPAMVEPHLTVSCFLGKIKSMMIHGVYKALQSWYIQLSIGTCRHRKKDLHKHRGKSMFHFFVPGVHKQCCTILKKSHKKDKIDIMIAFLLDHSAKKYLVHEKTQRQ